MEANALRAGLTPRAEAWRWGSLWRRQQPPTPDGEDRVRLCVWPLAEPPGWVEEVNRGQPSEELEALRRSAQRGQPYGDETWVKAGKGS